MSKRKNYSKMYDKPEVESEIPADEPVEASATPVEEEKPAKVEPAYKDGIIANCEKLNIRTNPSLKAAVECVMPKNTRLMFKPVADIDEWVFVVVDNEINGFCMKKYIKELN